MQWSFIESFTDDNSYVKTSTITASTQQKTCNAGEKYNSTTGECVSCEDGTYQDKTNHTLIECKNHPSLNNLRDKCSSGYVMEQKYSNAVQNKNEPLVFSELCTMHPTLGQTRNTCADGTYLSEDRYNNQINATKGRAITSQICEAHPSLQNVRTNCDDGKYLSEDRYNNQINATKGRAITSQICEAHPSLQNVRTTCADGTYLSEDRYNNQINAIKDGAITGQICEAHPTWDDIVNNKVINSCEQNKYFDKNKYDEKRKNKKDVKMSLDDICTTIPFYPLNVKNSIGDNFTSKQNVEMYFKQSSKFSNYYLTILDSWNTKVLLPSNNPVRIPITWNKDTNKITIETLKKRNIPFICVYCKNPPFVRTKAIVTKLYGKVVNKHIQFVEDKSEIEVEMRNNKIFVVGTNIEIIINNCNDNQYIDSQTNTCKNKEHNCPIGQYSTNFGSSGTHNDPICVEKRCPNNSYYASGYGSSRTSNDPICVRKIHDCPLGQYSTEFGSSTTRNDPKCVGKTHNCSPGQYSTKFGSSTTRNDPECVGKTHNCPPGQYSTKFGSSTTRNDPECVRKTHNCSPGQYSTEFGSSTTRNDPICKSCGVGTYQDESGKSECKSCGVGTYHNQTGQSSKFSCITKTCPIRTVLTNYEENSTIRDDSICTNSFHIQHVDGTKVGFRVNGTVYDTFEIKTKEQSGKYWIRIYPKGVNVTKHESNWGFSNISGEDYASQSHAIIKHDTDDTIFYLIARHSYKAPHWYFLAVENNRLVWKDANWWLNNKRECQFHFVHPNTTKKMKHNDVEKISRYTRGLTEYTRYHLYSGNYWGRHANFIGYPV